MNLWIKFVHNKNKAIIFYQLMFDDVRDINEEKQYNKNKVEAYNLLKKKAILF